MPSVSLRTDDPLGLQVSRSFSLVYAGDTMLLLAVLNVKLGIQHSAMKCPDVGVLFAAVFENTVCVTSI